MIQKFLGELNKYQELAPFYKFRPLRKPQKGATARAWWVYAAQATTKRIFRYRFSVARLESVASARGKYIAAHLEYLKHGSKAKRALVRELEQEFPE